MPMAHTRVKAAPVACAPDASSAYPPGLTHPGGQSGTHQPKQHPAPQEETIEQDPHAQPWGGGA